MRTKSLRQSESFCGELPRSFDDVQRQALTRGALLARLLQISSTRVERLTLAVENSEYYVPAATLSTAMMGEHLGSRF